MENTNKQLKPITVLGSGSWATALVKILLENEVMVHWCLRREDDIPHLLKHGRNPRYLSTAQLDLNKIKPTVDVKEAVSASDTIIIAIPSAFAADTLSPLEKSSFEGKTIITSVKGMMPELHCTVTDYLQDEFNVKESQLGVIAGPCHAEEVSMERRSYLTVASSNEELANSFAEQLRCHYIQTTTNNDLHGVEYCAVMKNIFAIACGIARGLTYGDNYQAVLVSNAAQEAKRFLDKAFPQERDLNASAYLGDILVTTYSQFSRNRMLGNMIGQGYSVKAAQVEMGMIAEGYFAVEGMIEKVREQEVDMPVTEAIYNVLYEKIAPVVEFRILSDKLS